MKHNVHSVRKGVFCVNTIMKHNVHSVHGRGEISCVNTITKHNVHSLGEGEFLVSMQSWNTMFTLWGRENFWCQCIHETQCSLCSWKRGNFLCQHNHKTQCSLGEGEFLVSINTIMKHNVHSVHGRGEISCVNTITKHNVHSLGEGEFLVSINTIMKHNVLSVHGLSLIHI